MNSEYAIENGKPISLKKLQPNFLMPKKDYAKAHQNLPILTHDIAINVNNSILLLFRDNVPEKAGYWVVGGRVNRGISLTESIKKKVKEECDLNVNNIIPLGYSRTFFETDPFGHGKGTDTLNLMFYAEGKGQIKLDPLHSKTLLITKQNYNLYKPSLHPAVQEILEKALQLIN